MKVWVVYKVCGSFELLTWVHGVYITKEKAEVAAIDYEKNNPNFRCYFQEFEVQQ